MKKVQHEVNIDARKVVAETGLEEGNSACVADAVGNGHSDDDGMD